MITITLLDIITLSIIGILLLLIAGSFTMDLVRYFIQKMKELIKKSK